MVERRSLAVGEDIEEQLSGAVEGHEAEAAAHKRDHDLAAELHDRARERTENSRSAPRRRARDLRTPPTNRSARFVYADPGRQTDSELRRWADEHRALWTRLRHTGITVHVAVITRTVAAQHRYSRLLAIWLNAPSAQPLTPEDWERMAAIKAAILAADPAGFDRWGGLNPARRMAILAPPARRTRGPRRAHGRLLDPSRSRSVAPVLTA